MVFKEGSNIIYWSFSRRENYHEYMYCLSRLHELGYVVESVTSDKHGSLVSSVKTIFPEIPHQYCTVHIQRRCQSLLTKNPETQAGKDLLEVVLFINRIRTHNDKEIFLRWLKRYEKRYQAFINQRTYSLDPYSEKRWWYTHKNLRTAFRHLRSSTDNMFHYLNNPNIPKDTNGLEVEFSHLKTKLRAHCGLTRERRARFIRWYWSLKSTQNVH